MKPGGKTPAVGGEAKKISANPRCTMSRPAVSSLKRGELVDEIRKWDSNFLDEGMTKEMLKATLKQIYLDNPITNKIDKMPALGRLTKKELQDLCAQQSLECLAKETNGELQLKLRKHYLGQKEAVGTDQDTVTFGKMKGHSFAEVLEDKPYAQWVVNAQDETSPAVFTKLARYLRENGVYPTEERKGIADERQESMAEASGSMDPPRSLPPATKEPEPKSTGPRAVCRKRRDTTMADDTPQVPTEPPNVMVQMMQMMSMMMNLNARLVEVEKKTDEPQQPSEQSYVMTEGSGVTGSSSNPKA